MSRFHPTSTERATARFRRLSRLATRLPARAVRLMFRRVEGAVVPRGDAPALEVSGPPYPTLAHAIADVGRRCPEAGYVFQAMDGAETQVTYSEVEELTARRAAALQELGLRKGDRVGLIVVEPRDFVLTFLAAVRIGVVPVPLYPPLAFGALDSYAERTGRILDTAGARVLLASAKLQHVLWGLVAQVPSLERLVTVEGLEADARLPQLPAITPEDIAFLQFTSGSTANPKGVVVTHAALMANCHAMIVDGVEKGLGDGVLVSWLPLYHDMGLVGFVLAAIAHGLTSVLIPTMRFIRKPSAWFDAIHRHRATMSCAPNFGYALITRRARPADLARWDLSSLDVLCCGAEPINADTVRAFQETFGEHCSLRPEAFMPAYGMAEATLAISFKPVREVFRTRLVDAERFQAEGRVTEPLEGDAGQGREVLEHVSCGRPFPGHEVGVFAEDGTRLPEGMEGELRLRGPSVTAGYFQDHAETRAVFRDGWLHTGDLGYILDGEIYVTGRLKDLLILNGRNVHPQAIEWDVAEVPGVRKGNAVAFAVPGATTEQVVVVAECRTDAPEEVRRAIEQAIQRSLGVPPADVVLLEPGSLPKTSSGKLQRRKTREQYLEGTLGTEGPRTLGSRGSKRMVARHVARSLWSRVRARVTRPQAGGTELG